METIDESTVAARLRSPIHGALSHVLSVTMPVVGADAAAIRLYHSVAQAGRDAALVLPPSGARSISLAELEAWPMESGSLFALLQSSGPMDATFRPADRFDGTLTGGGALASGAIYGMMGRVQPVTDAICVAFTVRPPTWCVAAFLRCGRRDPFSPGAMVLLDHLRATLAWVVLTGVQRATHVGLPATSDEPMRQRAGSGDALTRLSDTERRVLDLLMQGLTEREAAEQIGRSPHTVHVHVKNVYRKLAVSSRRQLRTLVQQAKLA